MKCGLLGIPIFLNKGHPCTRCLKSSSYMPMNFAYRPLWPDSVTTACPCPCTNEDTLFARLRFGCGIQNTGATLLTAVRPNLLFRNSMTWISVSGARHASWQPPLPSHTIPLSQRSGNVLCSSCFTRVMAATARSSCARSCNKSSHTTFRCTCADASSASMRLLFATSRCSSCKSRCSTLLLVNVASPALVTAALAAEVLLLAPPSAHC
mmetsp:Transcript_31015/g.56408  ORF Transcript_31015/g.56408 Transcript_31015/m.56408 type:complete len:209 (+) Transcript_31015:35-661(+)